MPRRARKLTPGRSARHLFGAELRRHRKQAGMSLEKLATVVPYSRSHLSRIETAEYMPPPDLPTLLDAAFGSGQLFRRLYEIAQHEAHPDEYRRFMEAEARARRIQSYAGCFIPGLIQTEDYTRTLFRTHAPDRPAGETERMVSRRMARQALLRSGTPPHTCYLIDEAVLRRPVGGTRIWRDQLGAVADLADDSAVAVHVLPFSHGEHALIGGHLGLFTLPNGTVLAFEESITMCRAQESPNKAKRLREAYQELCASALPPQQSAAFIRAVMDELPS
ncbi:helix-turn-helix transcriptional regulator [Streptomyces thioluteus]|uniref:Helix-turn-helix transcriptional regulator n=2 Tax=Streptomyces thioluteus TaxID=66431 RepID=A0ABN3WKU4_STRTU